MDNKTHNLTAIPPLDQAYKIQQDAIQLGFKWPDTKAIFIKLMEEMAELQTAIEKKDFENIKEEIGDLLFTTINFCCLLDIKPGVALEYANQKFTQRFNRVKKIARKNNVNMALSSLTELQALWKNAKQYQT